MPSSTLGTLDPYQYAADRISGGVPFIKTKATVSVNNGIKYHYGDMIEEVGDSYYVRYSGQRTRAAINAVKEGALFIRHDDAGSYHEILGIVVKRKYYHQLNLYTLWVRKPVRPFEYRPHLDETERKGGKKIENGIQKMQRDLFGVPAAEVFKRQIGVQYTDAALITREDTLDIIRDTIVQYRVHERKAVEAEMDSRDVDLQLACASGAHR